MFDHFLEKATKKLEETKEQNLIAGQRNKELEEQSHRLMSDMQLRLCYDEKGEEGKDMRKEIGESLEDIEREMAELELLL